MLEVARWIARWDALVPVAVVAYLSLRGLRPDWRLRLIVVALALSVVANLIAKTMADAGVPNLWLTYALAPVQFGLLLAVVVPRTSRVAFPLFLVLCAISLGRATWNIPEHVITVLAGGAVVGALIQYRTCVRYQAALIVYCGATVPGLLALAYGVDSSSWNPEYFAAWLGYQVPRLIALLMLSHAALTQPRMQTEVARGGTDRADPVTVRPARHAGRVARRDRRTSVA